MGSLSVDDEGLAGRLSSVEAGALEEPALGEPAGKVAPADGPASGDFMADKRAFQRFNAVGSVTPGPDTAVPGIDRLAIGRDTGGGRVAKGRTADGRAGG
jgi:hypothetical protein